MTRKSPDAAERIAVFAGSFDPFTLGHADIVSRGLELFDRVAVCVGVNVRKPGTDPQARVDAIRAIYAAEPRVEVAAWSGLTAEYAKSIGARFLLRGVRSVKDFEYERDMADANKAVFGLETVVLYSSPALSYVSSSLVRELEAFGHDASQFLPKAAEAE